MDIELEKKESNSMNKEEKYGIICEKLGFEPRNYKFVPSGYEDDSKPYLEALHYFPEAVKSFLDDLMLQIRIRNKLKEKGIPLK